MKYIGWIATVLGVVLCSFGQINFIGTQLMVFGASAIQLSQLANESAVHLLAGIGLIVFGLGLVVVDRLGDIENTLAQRIFHSQSTGF